MFAAVLRIGVSIDRIDGALEFTREPLYDDCRCEGSSGGVDPGDRTGAESWPPSLGAFRRHVSPVADDWKKLVGSAGFGELSSDARLLECTRSGTRPSPNPERFIRDEQGDHSPRSN